MKRQAIVVFYMMSDKEIYLDSAHGQETNAIERAEWLQDMKWVEKAWWKKVPMNQVDIDYRVTQRQHIKEESK